ncbi:MAG: hypothetical protein ACPL88_10465, partial [Bryobacteraceae bacterium]
VFEFERPAGPWTAGRHAVELPPYRRYVDDFRELAAAVRGEGALRVTPDEEVTVHRAVLAASGKQERTRHV